MATTLNIGLTAYHALGNLVFVRVPSERGRYLLTDLCVLVVACPHCGALIGEPCRRGHWRAGILDGGHGNCCPKAHGSGVHCARKNAAKDKYGERYATRLIGELQIHLCAVDVEAALRPAENLEPALSPVDIDFQVTRKA